MTQISISYAKGFLRVFHGHDDALLGQLIKAATEQALRFLNRTQLPTLPVDNPSESSSEQVPSDEDPVPEDVRIAIVRLVQAQYEGLSADEAEKLRQAAFHMLMPYRIGLGV